MQTTEEIFLSRDTIYVGDFTDERMMMDYEWFTNYTPDRQRLQDKIVHSFLDRHNFNKNQKRRTAIYMCGIFGSGKTKTLKWMNENKMIDLDSFVLIDPDKIKHLLPEFSDLLKDDLKNGTKHASKAVHKESTYISLLIEKKAIDMGVNYIVDGSLQNWEWYKEHFNEVRYFTAGDYTIIIIRVHCIFDVAVERCDKRALSTGRHIDKDYLKSINDKVPIAFDHLKNEVDIVIEIDNTISPVVKRFIVN